MRDRAAHYRLPRPVGPALMALVTLAILLVMAAVSSATEFRAPPATQPMPRGSAVLPGMAMPQIMSATTPMASPATPRDTTVGGGVAATQTVAPTAATQPAVTELTAGAGATRPAVTSELDALAINRGDSKEKPATQAATTSAGTPSATSFEVGRVVMSLAAVIALILFLRWGSKKVFAMPTSGSSAIMQVVSRTTLAPRQQLLLVRVGRRLMIIGDSAGRLTSIGQIADPDEVASLIGQTQSPAASVSVPTSFTSMFRRFSGRGQADAGWEELQNDSAAGLIQERSGLLDADGDEDRNGGPAVVADNGPDSPPPRSGLPPDEAEAEKAVEAARSDIQALRAKLREVTGRLTDPPAA